MMQDNKNVLATQTMELGSVDLWVKNKDPMVTFYRQCVGLRIISEADDRIELGDGGKTLIRLLVDDFIGVVSPKEAGLYHVALVFPTQARLAKTLARMFELAPATYQGSADHLATEAFYFEDPEGNGVELYYDKPRNEWPMTPDGKPQVGSEYLDESAFVRTHLADQDDGNPVDMGHVHLRVGDIDTARNFYHDKLGFDVILSMPTALFVSRDNYHHHIGLNTWQSRGAGPRGTGKTGLAAFELNFLDNRSYQEAKERLEDAAIENETPAGFTVADPWGTKIKVFNKDRI